MSKKSIFSASFEESLNLEDDGFLKLQYEQHEKIAKYFHKGRPSIWFRIQTLVFSLLFTIGLNFMLLVVSLMLHEDSDSLTLPISDNSFLNGYVFLSGFFIWSLLVLCGKTIKQGYLLPYRYNFHVFTTMIWFMIELDLLVMDFILPIFSYLGILLVLAIFLLLGFWLTNVKLNYLRKLIYEEKNSNASANRIIKFISLYGLSFLGISVLIKRTLSGFLVDIPLQIKGFGFLLMWLLLNVASIAVLLFIGFPYFLQAYYKWKYPEEYRDWEGKTKLEWYGKNYLKKHRELLDDENN